MNVFSKNVLKIEYTMRIDRFSASKDNEWNSFSPTVLAFIVMIARGESKSERVTVNQHRSYIKIIKVLNNFMISFTSKDFTSSLTLESESVKCLAESYENILERVSNYKKVRQPFQIQSQRKGKYGEQMLHFFDDSVGLSQLLVIL